MQLSCTFCLCQASMLLFIVLKGLLTYQELFPATTLPPQPTIVATTYFILARILRLSAAGVGIRSD